MAETVPVLDPAPLSAEEEAVALLRIAAEVEGAAMAQYLFAAGSLLPDVSLAVAGFDHPILSNDWYDLIRDIAKQEMGHLITVQNLLLSLDAAPHLDRENFPLESPLYPFPFKLQPVRLESLAKFVCAEAPREVPATDQSDFAEAVEQAKIVVGEVSRAGQVYERLFWLFQDADAPQQPWLSVKNPFPSWPNWHVDPAKMAFNQDRQAETTEWRGSDSGDPPDSAVYVLQVRDKATAREAVYKIGLQGEGPVGEPGVTHFDKFLRVYREQRALAQHAGAPAFARNQADDPSVGLNGPATITDPKALVWAQLANTRYQMLLMDIALAISVGLAGTAPGTTATRRHFYTWAFSEMVGTIKPLSAELRQMPLILGGSADGPLAGVPYELPNEHLPSNVTDQLQYLRDRVAESTNLRARIASTFAPTPKQKSLLTQMAGVDATIVDKLG
ncbi:ferritin-like domain-containing protein [Mesorhizobium sp. VK23B]|uniref:Ferritin-like domain-containing protein n=1 Tax=Mesorhizobium dulcispinae TaxID=3072316 RepID=A0ABU4XEE2_9HYPH|nr:MULTISPECIES: ferritin-like domain-containing protein [unclassified Mesorhizobium]MDX8464905.1 ferritin-like domain-containing protein [Mesorhizobium sp. VK23B]MDX8472878.1 ferritin-like domain-containing protein [Mesorhizobium sp. VK23A]